VKKVKQQDDCSHRVQPGIFQQFFLIDTGAILILEDEQGGDITHLHHE
jgi:hypothetical protein